MPRDKKSSRRRHSSRRHSPSSSSSSSSSSDSRRGRSRRHSSHSRHHRRRHSSRRYSTSSSSSSSSSSSALSLLSREQEVEYEWTYAPAVEKTTPPPPQSAILSPSVAPPSPMLPLAPSSVYATPTYSAPFPFYPSPPLLYHMPYHIPHPHAAPALLPMHQPQLGPQLSPTAQQWALAEPARNPETAPASRGGAFPGLSRAAPAPLEFHVESDEEADLSDLDGISEPVRPETPQTPTSQDEWRMYVSPEGHPYYFNHATGESVWAEVEGGGLEVLASAAGSATPRPGSPAVGWLSRVSSLASIIASAIEPATPRSAFSGTGPLAHAPASSGSPRVVLNDLSLPERLAGRVATLLERGVEKLQGGDKGAAVLPVPGPHVADEKTLEEGLGRGSPAVCGDQLQQTSESPLSKVYQPASELRRQGLLPPLPPATSEYAAVVELPPPSPRSAAAAPRTLRMSEAAGGAEVVLRLEMEAKKPRVERLEHEDAVLQFLLEQEMVQKAMEAWKAGDAQGAKNMLLGGLQSLLKQRDKETRPLEVSTLRHLIAEYVDEFLRAGADAAAASFMRGLMSGNLVAPDVVVREVVNFLWPKPEAVQAGAELIAFLVINGGVQIHIIQDMFNIYVPQIGDIVATNPKAPDFFFILLAEIANKAPITRVPTEQVASLVRFLVGDNVEMLCGFARMTAPGRSRRWVLDEIARLSRCTVTEVENSLGIRANS